MGWWIVAAVKRECLKCGSYYSLTEMACPYCQEANPEAIAIEPPPAPASEPPPAPGPQQAAPPEPEDPRRAKLRGLRWRLSGQGFWILLFLAPLWLELFGVQSGASTQLIGAVLALPAFFESNKVEGEIRQLEAELKQEAARQEPQEPPKES